MMDSERKGTIFNYYDVIGRMYNDGWHIRKRKVEGKYELMRCLYFKDDSVIMMRLDQQHGIMIGLGGFWPKKYKFTNIRVT